MVLLLRNLYNEVTNNLVLTKVESSNIDSVGWEADMLYVKYISGGYYVYQNVPRGVFDAFCEAPSKGRFINTEIKNKYNYTRLN